MKNLLSTSGLARISARRPWYVLGIWLLVLILSGVAATGLGDAFTTESNFTGRPDSVRGEDLLTERMRGNQDQAVTETVVIRSESLTVDDPAFREVVDNLAIDLNAIPTIVSGVMNYYDAVATNSPGAEALVSADRHTLLVPVTLVGDFDEASENSDALLDIIATQGGDGIEVLTVGDISVNEEFNRLAESDLVKGEGIGLLAATVVLVVVFGALVAAGLPVVLSLVSIFVAIGLTALLGRVMGLSFFIVNMITMIGLAVGIDYALFIVERYREERRRGREKARAIEIAGATASKSVLLSGTTVVLALLGMFMIPTVLFRSLGAGAILVVVVAVVASLTLIPAMLSLLGDRIDWPRRRHYDESAMANQAIYDHETIHSGMWGRLARIVMARPVISVVVSVGLLLLAAVPYLDLHRGQGGVESLPPGEIRTAYEILSRDFPAGRLAPLHVVIDADEGEETTAAIDQLVASLAPNAVFGSPDPVQWNEGGDLAELRIPLTVDGSSPAALDAVSLLRDDLIPDAFVSLPVDVFVTGGPAFNADFEEVVQTYTPIVFGFVLTLSFLLLMVAFRSIIVPAKAIVMNLLSVGAAYGLLVLVFQKGVGADMLGFQQTPTIEAWVPIFLFCVLFGLSMDYHVFLISRIKEHYDLSKDNRESVAVGLQATARIITGAALIMVAVFAGFASGQLVMFQQMGFGLAVAVILDATLVRSVLVPASMTLLGDRNWYLPHWLEWLPNLQLENVPDATVPAPTLVEGPDELIPAVVFVD